MAIRFREVGCLYKAYVKDKELFVEFAPNVIVHRPLPFVKEDFLISHTFPVSNVALLLESESGNLLVAWFTGGMSVYMPVGNKLRMMAHTNFNIYNFRDEIATTCDNGLVQSGTKYHITRTHLYRLQSYFLKEYPNLVVFDIPDGQCGFLIDIQKNFKAVGEVIAGTDNYPGFIREGKVLSKISDEDKPLLGTYIIEQPENGKFTYNL